MDILGNIGLTISGFIFLIFVVFGYLKSTKFKSFESILFKIMLITICISSILEIVFGFLVINAPEFYNIQNILVKIYILIMIIWVNSFSLYLIVVPNKETFSKNKKYVLISVISLIILTIVPYALVLVLNKISTLNPDNMIGSINAVYKHSIHTCVLPFLTVIVSFFLKSFRNMEKTNKIPYYSMLVVFLVETFITLVVKIEINELTFLFSLITVIVYLTSESVNNKLIKKINETKESEKIALNGQNEFISSMSHDIRTPLGALIGISEVLLHDNNLTLEKTKEELSSVKEASEKLTELLKNLIDVSKINEGNITVATSPVSVKSLTEYIEQLVNEKVKKKNTTFTYNISERMSGSIECDFDKLSRSLILIINAIASKTDNGSIKVSYSGEVNGEIYNFKADIESVNSKLTEEDLNIDFNTYMEMYTDKINTIDSEKLGIIIAKYFINILKGTIKYKVDETGKTICSITVPVSLGRGEIAC